MFPPEADPCADNTCSARALCVRSAAPRGYTCLCPTGLAPADDGNHTCEPYRTSLETLPGADTDTDADEARSDTTCPLSCGPGACERRTATDATNASSATSGSSNLWQCRCPPLYAGTHCQHYRCARYCLHRGKCLLDPTVDVTDDGLPALKCICLRGYTGPRCAHSADATSTAPTTATATAAHDCTPHHCVCSPPYSNPVCAACAARGACGAGAVCVVTAAGAECRPHICTYFCLNGGKCSVSGVGGVSCACAGGWSGERCQRPACEDAACAPPPAPPAPAPAPAPAPRTPPNHTNKHHEGYSACTEGGCLRGGVCRHTDAGAVCACLGPWGGAACAHYVGHDHACAAAAAPCRAPAVCVWGPDVSAVEAGSILCACPAGETCAAPGGGPQPAAGGAWLGAALTLLSVLAIAAVAAVIYLARRRHSRGAFVHARLTGNVEIANPMYLAGEDEIEPHTHSNGGNHFANPVYESMYAPPQDNPTEEHANLLAAADGTPPPAERAALL